MEFEDIVTAFGAAVEAGDGTALGALFTEDGVYHDIFYGAFEGRAAIKDMLEGIFHRDAKDFRWEFLDPASNGTVGYAHWLFSYTSTTPHTDGQRVVFDGVGLFFMEDGLIARYEDVSNSVVPLKKMNVPQPVIDRQVDKWQGWLEARPGYGSHAKG
ncbi:MAG TPA: nuclear transport factor 2 family protein [Alphaproteobacteria bacterium]|nr:nuclear transport factor 2 family protein [Alphaproteobacteria bacterium]